MKSKGITDFLIKHAKENPVSFHMPGHKGRDMYSRFGHEEFAGCLQPFDITEIPGADNLFLTESVLGETAEKYEKLYNVKKSYLLVNGTSCGLMAAIMASVPAGSKLIMARNCHKSVFNGLRLAGAKPVYAFPSVLSDYGISGPVEPEEIERLLNENPDAKAVILPSPNYYGICSDISAIAKAVHRAGKILIVDQAHGAHLKMFSNYGPYGNLNLPPSAEECGADIVVNSIHKTLLSFTQSAVMNVNSDRVDLTEIEDRLQILESTSPSYLLMASLDINAEIMLTRGREITDSWAEGLRYFHNRISETEGIRLIDLPNFSDRTKLNIDMSAFGINGDMLEKKLMERGIYSELATGNILMCMTGAGNSLEDFEKLADALEDIALEAGCTGFAPEEQKVSETGDIWIKKRPLGAVPSEKISLDIDRCAGKTCAASVIPYPPGIPLVCPGEKIDAEDIAYIKRLRANDEKVIGFGTDNTLIIGND